MGSSNNISYIVFIIAENYVTNSSPLNNAVVVVVNLCIINL